MNDQSEILRLKLLDPEKYKFPHSAALSYNLGSVSSPQISAYTLVVYAEDNQTTENILVPDRIFITVDQNQTRWRPNFLQHIIMGIFLSNSNKNLGTLRLTIAMQAQSNVAPLWVKKQ